LNIISLVQYDSNLPKIIYLHGIYKNNIVVNMVLLKPGEKLLLEEKASGEGFGNGTLCLTNGRIVFERTTGLISKKTEICLILPLHTVEDIRVEGLIGKKLVIQGSDERTGRISKWKFGVPNPSGWEMSVKSAIQSA